jgi:hypothetical protein
LPSCCRRDGKHHCAAMSQRQTSEGMSLKSTSTKCPLFPREAGTLPKHHDPLRIADSVQFSPPISVLARASSGTDGSAHAFLGGETNKRGPPIQLVLSY